MGKSIRKIWNVFTTILVALAVLLAVLLVGTRLIGLRAFTVLSGSMEPTYPTGSLLYVKEVPVEEIDAGTVITFMLDEDTIATHRVVEVVPDEEDASVVRFRTKGDANEAEDANLVHCNNVIGTPVFHIPQLGYFAAYVQTPAGRYAAICVGALVLLLLFLPEFFSVMCAKEKPAKHEK